MISSSEGNAFFVKRKKKRGKIAFRNPLPNK